MDLIFCIFVFYIGAFFGSFSALIVDRWPREESIIRPRSFCRSCKRTLSFFDLIPLFSFLFFRGKCRTCSANIPKETFFIEFSQGVLFLVPYLFFGMSLSFIEICIFTALAWPAFIIDFRHMYLPDICTIPGIIFALLGASFISSRSVESAILGAAFGGGVLWLTAFLYKKYKGIDGLGFGDVKLMAWIGALLGAAAIPFVLLVSSLLGSIVGVILIIFKSRGRQTPIPFGPFLFVATYAYWWLIQLGWSTSLF